MIFTIRQAHDTRYLEFIKGVDKELAEQTEKEKVLSNREECVVYAYNSVNICAGYVPHRKMKISGDFFNYAITMMWAYSVLYPQDDHSIKSSWPTLTRWIKYEITESSAYPVIRLPEAMKKELAKEKKEDTDPVTLYIELKELIKSKQR